MDINIVNTILRLCYEQQTCLFEVPILSDYCLEQRLCTNPKYVLASIKNYMEIFKISRDRTRIEFFMPVCIWEKMFFFNFIFFSFFSSLKSVEIIYPMVYVKLMVNYVRIYMFVMIISQPILVAGLSIAHIHIN
jgi:hypothetical protein